MVRARSWIRTLNFAMRDFAAAGVVMFSGFVAMHYVLGL
jgi:hypothetical protein